MKDIDKDTIKDLFDYLQIILRYIAAGFVTIVVLMLVDSNLREYYLSLFKDYFWMMTMAVGVTGILIYAMHHACLDSIFYKLSVWLFKKNYTIPDVLLNDINVNNTIVFTPRMDKKNTNGTDSSLPPSSSQIIFSLMSKSIIRKSGGSLFLRNFQKELETKLAILMFLYGSFYSMTLIPWCYKLIALSLHKDSTIDCKMLFVFTIIGLIIGAMALLFDYNLTKRECWLAASSKTNNPLNCETEFTYVDADGTATDIYLLSSFNNWTPSQEYKLKETSTKNTWKIKVHLPKGTFYYKYCVNGTIMQDPANIELDGTVYNNSVLHIV